MNQSLVIGVYPGPIDTEMTVDLTVDKVPATVVAKALVQALEDGAEDVLPDHTAQEMIKEWKVDAKAIEQKIAAASLS